MTGSRFRKRRQGTAQSGLRMLLRPINFRLEADTNENLEWTHF